MSAAEQLQATIRKSIPLSEAMQFRIDALDLEGIRVSAPLEPNINIHGTGFAGSIYSVAVLTGWALCTHIMQTLELDAELVVGSAEIRYRAPVRGRLECRCDCSEAQRNAFCEALRASGKGRLVLDVDVGDTPQARLHGTFYAIAR
jgi:thioesterase domain-containing protein